MYNLGEQFKFNLEKSSMNPESVFKGNKYRITILTSSLIRLEYSEEGKFTDLPTLNVWYRNFKKPDFKVVEDEKTLNITTEFFNLIYQKEKHFYGGKINLSSNLRVTSTITNKAWYYTFPEVRNYDVDIYSVEDNKDIKSKSLFSLYGFVTLDDSKTDFFDNYGCLEKNDYNHIMYGNKFFTCLKDYFKITGKPSLLPRYAFGNWWSRNIEYNDQNIQDIIAGFKEHDIPLSIIMLNNTWSKKDENKIPSFSFNRESFNNPIETIKNIHSYTELRKYSGSDYIRISEGIYSHQREYVPALSFQQEPELGEGGNAVEIS